MNFSITSGTQPPPQHGQPRRQQALTLFLAEELKWSELAAVYASFVLDFAQMTDARNNFLSLVHGDRGAVGKRIYSARFPD